MDRTGGMITHLCKSSCSFYQLFWLLWTTNCLRTIIDIILDHQNHDLRAVSCMSPFFVMKPKSVLSAITNQSFGIGELIMRWDVIDTFERPIWRRGKWGILRRKPWCAWVGTRRSWGWVWMRCGGEYRFILWQWQETCILLLSTIYYIFFCGPFNHREYSYMVQVRMGRSFILLGQSWMGE